MSPFVILDPLPTNRIIAALLYHIKNDLNRLDMNVSESDSDIITDSWHAIGVFPTPKVNDIKQATFRTIGSYGVRYLKELLEYCELLDADVVTLQYDEAKDGPRSLRADIDDMKISILVAARADD